VLLALLATLSLLACKLMIIAWATPTDEYWPVWSGRDAEGRKTEYSILKIRNPSRVGFRGITELPTPEPGLATEVLRNNPDRPGAYRSVKWGGFELSAGEARSEYLRGVTIPLWLAVGTSLFLPAAWLRRLYRRKRCGR
jgi:hypothetical protein